MGLETTLDLSPDLVVKLQQRAEQQARTWQEVATEILEASTGVEEQYQNGSIVSNSDSSEELEAELLTIVNRIKSHPPNYANFYPAEESLAEVLERTNVYDPDFDSAAWDREWAKTEAEINRINREDDIAEGRG